MFFNLSKNICMKNNPLKTCEIVCTACTNPGFSQGSYSLCMTVFFTVASLLNCLQQLRQENHHLEEHINMLTSRRDQLLAVNARLSHAPAVVTNSLAPGLAAGHLGSVARGPGMQGRSPRVVNNALGHVETNNTQVGLCFFLYWTS